MTLHDLRVPAARSFKELPCFGVKFSNIHPASESGFPPGIFFGGGSIVMQISFVMLIFLLFSTQFFWGRGKFPGANCLREKPPVSRTMYQNTEISVFKGNPNKFLYCMSYYNYKYVENIKTRINFLDKRQIS